MAEQNIFHYTLTSLTASSSHRVPLTEEQKREADYKPMNFVVALNNTDKLLFLQLNDSEDERFPISPSGGIVSFEPNDNMKFSSVQIVETEAASPTGKVYVTVGVLQ